MQGAAANRVPHWARRVCQGSIGREPALKKELGAPGAALAVRSPVTGVGGFSRRAQKTAPFPVSRGGKNLHHLALCAWT